MSQINTVLERIANIEITIGVPGLGRPSVQMSAPYQPSDTSSLQCPFFVNEIHGGQSDLPVANGQQYRETDVYAYLCVERHEADTNLKYGAMNTAKWVDAVYAMFSKHVRLSAPVVNIAASTNTSPIKITTGTPHSLSSGESVTIANHLVNTSANGVWIATVVDYCNFTIPTAGNGIGGKTGTAVPTQPDDMGNIIDAYIKNWNLVDYEYGSTNYLALQFVIPVREMYVTTMQP